LHLRDFSLFGIKIKKMQILVTAYPTKGGIMFFINELKKLINNDVIIIFLIISYILIFRTSKELNRKNYHRDYKIVRFTGIVYGLLALAAAGAIYIF